MAAARRGRLRLDRFGRTLGLIALLGLVGRAAYVVATKRGLDTCGRELCGDALYYSSSANVLALGRGFEDRLGGPGTFHQAADHPPLTTLVMAPLNYVLWRHSVLVQRLGMVLLGAVVIVLIGVLVRRLAGDRAGLVAAGLAAVNPNFWMNDVLVMSETIGTVCIVIVLLLLYRFIDEPSWARAAWVGVACGIAGLARAELLLFLPLTVAPVALWARSLSVPARLGRLALAGGTALLVLAPWTIYNLSRFDEPVFLSTNDGITLLGANCDAVYGIDDPGGIGFWNLNCTTPVADRIPPGADESVVSSVYRRAGVDYITSHKKDLPRVVLIRNLRGWGFFGPDQMAWLNQGEGRDSWATWLGYALWWVLVVPAVAGAVILRRRRVPIWPLVSTALIVTVTLTAFYGIVRFRLPADVSAVALAAVAIDAWWARWRPAAEDAAAEATDPAPDPAGAPA